MKISRLNITTFIIAFILVGNLNAHVGLDYPNGRETFFVGDTIEVKWHNIILHNPNNWDLYFSPDGGASWQSIQLDLPVSQFTYQWVVPNVITDKAQVRIRQDNVGTNYDDQSLNFTIDERVLGVSEKTQLLRLPNLISIYPNPFNPAITIEFSLPIESYIEIVVYNLMGHKINTLVNTIKQAGDYQVVWDGKNNLTQPVAGGVYILSIETGEFTQSRKIVFLK